MPRCFIPFPGIAHRLVVGVMLMGGTAPGILAQTTAETKEQQVAEKARLLALARVDWQRMMHRLHLQVPALPPAENDPKRPANLVQHSGSSWFDAQNRRYVRSSWGTWTNYDEAKAGDFIRPNPLVMHNGQPVRDSTAWWKQRRPEILTDVTRNVYGVIPATTPRVTFAVTTTDPNGLGGRAIKKTIGGRIDNGRYPAAQPRIDLTLYIPAKATGPVPVIVVMGNLPGGEAGQPTVPEQVLAAGWALAVFSPTTLQQDSGAGLNAGIIGLVNEGRDRQPADWGTLVAWSWGLSRTMDYLESDPAIDARRAALQGHSRWGKTVLLAAALDTRWAMAFVSCSGAMGVSLEKRNYGETIDNVAEPNLYHWLAGNFLRYAGDWSAMPTDAHDLVALVAPRPLFITGGTDDVWTDATGTFLAGAGASPVYELLGKRGLSTTQMPAPGAALMTGDLAFREHVGGHTDLPDWPLFLEFAQRYFYAQKR